MSNYVLLSAKQWAIIILTKYAGVFSFLLLIISLQPSNFHSFKMGLASLKAYRLLPTGQPLMTKVKETILNRDRL